MGLFDVLGDIGGGILDIGQTIARETVDFGAGLLGGAKGAVFGTPSPVPSVKRLSDLPEALGGLIGGAIGGGLRAAIQPVSAGAFTKTAERGVMTQQKTLATVGGAQRGQIVGTAGAEPFPQAAGLSFGIFQPGGVMPGQATALPGGAPIQTAGLFGDLTLPLIPQIGQFLFGGGQMAQQALAPPGAAAGTIFRVQNARLVPRPMFQIMNPTTGSIVTYKNVGRPILFSGDFAACKRVARVAGKARRYSRKR